MDNTVDPRILSHRRRWQVALVLAAMAGVACILCFPYFWISYAITAAVMVAISYRIRDSK